MRLAHKVATQSSAHYVLLESGHTTQKDVLTSVSSVRTWATRYRHPEGSVLSSWNPAMSPKASQLSARTWATQHRHPEGSVPPVICGRHHYPLGSNAHYVLLESGNKTQKDVRKSVSSTRAWATQYRHPYGSVPSSWNPAIQLIKMSSKASQLSARTIATRYRHSEGSVPARTIRISRPNFT